MRPRRDREHERARAAACRIDDVVRPCLTSIAYLARRSPLPPLDVVHEHTRVVLQQAKLKLADLDLPPRDAEDVFYALVAYIDEVLQSDDGPLKEYWQAHLLQLAHFGETRAGEGFFDRLDDAMQGDRVIVVRVYYVCLLLGFRGVYDTLGDLARENLIATARARVSALEAWGEGAPLSPFGARPNEPEVDRRRSRLLQAVASATACVALCWYAGVALVIDAEAARLVAQLEDAYDDLAGNVARVTPGVTP